MAIGNLYKQADWKSEKHVPVIECADSAGAGKPLEIKITVGKEIPHPNTTEHHIRWIRLYFQPEGGTVYEVGNIEFTAHGEAVEGANKGPAYTDPVAVFAVKLGKSGTLLATSYCNIHGLWESSKAVTVA
jgi:superoxide reductase